MNPFLCRGVRNLFELVTAVPDPHRDSHQVVVDDATEGCKDTHEQSDVSKDQNSLNGRSLSTNHILEDTKKSSHQEEDCTVTNITEHDTEQEREGHYCENSRIDFLIVRDTISVYDLLEDPGDIVSSEKRRWLNTMIMDYLKLRDLNVSVLGFDPFNLSHCCFIVKIGNPAEANIEATFNLKFVQGRIKSLFFHDEHLVHFQD